MNVMRAIDPRPPGSPSGAFEPANRELEILKDRLANLGCYEEAFDVSELLRNLDRTRHRYAHRDDSIL
jgi:hypothetical protein